MGRNKLMQDLGRKREMDEFWKAKHFCISMVLQKIPAEVYTRGQDWTASFTSEPRCITGSPQFTNSS